MFEHITTVCVSCTLTDILDNINYFIATIVLNLIPGEPGQLLATAWIFRVQTPLGAGIFRQAHTVPMAPVQWVPGLFTGGKAA